MAPIFFVTGAKKPQKSAGLPSETSIGAKKPQKSAKRHQTRPFGAKTGHFAAGEAE